MGDVVELNKRPPADPADLELARVLYRANMSLLSSALALLSLQLRGLADAVEKHAKS